MNLIYSILAAFSMFSALPMPQVPWEKEKIRYMLVALPLVGAVVGLVEYLWLRLCSRLAFGMVLSAVGFTLIPVLITGGIHLDGFISAVAALIAQRLCPGADAAMLPSHCSEEPAAKRVLAILNKNPIIFANMRLGEGTGGVCLLPLLDMALAVYGGNATFDAVGIDAYRPQGGKGC